MNDNTDRGKEQRLVKKLSRDQRIMFENLIMNLKSNILGFSQVHIPYFTGHGVQHAEGIIEQLDSMIPNEVLKHMNNIEVFILMCSAWLHDIGLLKDIDKDGRHLSNEEVRDQHHRLSRDLIREKHNELGLINSDIAEIVADISYCHRRRVDIDTYFPSEEITVNNSVVRVRFLSALVRLADAMDTGSKRAPAVLMGDVLKLPEKDKRHWRACQLIRGIKYATDRLAIVIDSRYKDEEERQISLWKFKDLYREFLPIREILIKNGLNYADLIEKLFNIINREEEEISGNRFFRRITMSWDDLHKMADSWTDMTVGTMRQKYNPELYIRRQEVEEEFATFLKSEKVGFAIVGDAGYGKTNLICSLAEEYRSGNVVLLYNGPSLTHQNIEGKILEDLSPSPEFRMSTFFDELLEEINEIMEEKNSYFIIFVDAIDRADNAKMLLKNINEMIAHIKYPRVKVVIACRTIIWKTLLDPTDFLYRTKFYTIRGREEVRLGEFSDEELKIVYQRYKKHYKLKTEIADLSRRTIDNCRIPLMLRLISEVYEEKEIPAHVPLGSVFDEYYKKMMERDMEIILEKIINKMIELKADHLTRKQLLEDPLIAQCMRDFTLKSPYVKLLDRRIIYEYGTHDEMIRFTFDKFFEYLLAERLLPRDEEHSKNDYINLIHQANEFSSLWGAVKIALLIKKDTTLLKGLILEDDYDVRKVMVDTLMTMSEEDYKMTHDFLGNLLSLDSTAAKRLVVLTLYEIRPHPIDLFVKALLDRDEAVRRLAIQYAYMLWITDHNEGAKVVRRVSSAGMRRLLIRETQPFVTSIELQARIFLNHPRETDAALLIDELGRKRVRILGQWKRFRSVVASIYARAAKTLLRDKMMTQLWGIEYNLWIRPFFNSSDEERERMRMIATYLDTRKELDSNAEQAIYELVRSNLILLRNMAILVLWAHARVHPELIMPLVRRLLASGDPRQVTVGLNALSYAPQLEEGVNIAPDIICSDAQYHWAICNFGLNLLAQKREKFEGFLKSILQKARDKGDMEVLKGIVVELGNIGIRHPGISLLTIKSFFNVDYKPVREALVESLARIRVLHPNIEASLKDYPKLLLDVRKVEHVSPYMEPYGMVTFFLDNLMNLPVFRDLVIDLIQRFTSIHTDEEFDELLEYSLEKAVETWLNEENFKAYLTWISQFHPD